MQSVLDIVKEVLGRLLKCLSHILPRFCTGSSWFRKRPRNEPQAKKRRNGMPVKRWWPQHCAPY